MKRSYIQIHPKDNVLAALTDLNKGDNIVWNDQKLILEEHIPAKHKFTTSFIPKGGQILMYGVLVGKASKDIHAGSHISLENTEHAAQSYGAKEKVSSWNQPDITKFKNKSFNGYHRADGQVGTLNQWLVIPLVFCENRNVSVIKEALLKGLGYSPIKNVRFDTQQLIHAYQNGETSEEILSRHIFKPEKETFAQRVFPNVDGIKFLTHEGGCGGTREDSNTLCNLLAGYITHPNVAGATILSLGCQNAQISILKDAISKLDNQFSKPVYYFEQQESLSESEFLEDIIKQTFIGLIEANGSERKPASLSHLKLGLECGGSDGFSGISANPTLGHTSDLLVALGGTAILAEFPELNGVEQELINRCTSAEIAAKFSNLMTKYAARAEAVGSGFESNPSPGNIKDGLITDAMKSAGAAKKGGSSNITAVLDYTEQAKQSGLNLLCTPGNDVESTTGLAGSGANVIVFTTGLGTPTGNPITPVIKMSSNTALFNRMNDIIDFDSGSIIDGSATPKTKGEELLNYIIKVASGEITPKAVKLNQDDFIPWKRGVSL